MKIKQLPLILFAVIVWQVCNGDEKEKVVMPKDTADKMQIVSPAFEDGDYIPVEYSCEGDDVSPTLIFKNIPEKAKSLVLICDDPDAPGGVFNHWTAYNISPNMTGLEKKIPKTKIPEILKDSLKLSFSQGINSFGKYGYGGPCPPRGSAHRYFFNLYALDTILVFGIEELASGVRAKNLRAKMVSHVMAEAVLMGKFSR